MTDNNDQPKRLDRRLLVLRLASSATVVALSAQAAEAETRFNSPENQQLAQRTTDRDPSDGEGRGRGGRGASDNDPRDGAGRGTGGRGSTDNDPRDAPGRSRSLTDNDPSDGPGRGRGR